MEESLKGLLKTLKEIFSKQEKINDAIIEHGKVIIELRKEQNHINNRLDYFINEVNSIIDKNQPGFIQEEEKKTEH
ncbi:hypothetical protein ACIQWI_24380 [Peribacillus frigoritolerans]